MTYAQITNGIVTNTVVADAGYADEHDLVALTGGAGIGWSYSNGAFSPPAPTPAPIPEAVTRAQAKIALARAGYYEQAAALVATLDVEAQIWWAEAETFRYEHPLVDGMCAALAPPISPEKKADLFRTAAGIV